MIRSLTLRLIHLPLLAAWAVALFFTARMLCAESHYRISVGLSEEPALEGAELDKALALNPWHGFAHAAKGRTMLAAGEWTGAIDHSEQALQTRFTLDIAKQLASAYFRSGNLTQSQEEFWDIFVYMPFDNEALYRLAHLEILQERPESAEILATRHLDYHSASPEIYWIIGKSHQMRQRYRLAMHWFHRFLMLEPTGVIPDETYDYINWEWIKTWGAYIRKVETGEIVPEEGARLEN